MGHIIIDKASAGDVPEVALMAGELLGEIMRRSGVPAFHFNLDETVVRLADFLAREKYHVFVARDGTRLAGFIALYESCALYAEGTFGTIPELYVRPGYRSQDLGRRLLDQAKSFAVSIGWKRLEVTTPPLPQFDQTLAFYEREGFAVAGGRKLKIALSGAC